MISHASAAVDVLAATPLISATSLASALGISVKNAIGLLDSLVAAGAAVEVTHRAKRRLFGLRAMARSGRRCVRHTGPSWVGAAAGRRWSGRSRRRGRRCPLTALAA